MSIYDICITIAIIVYLCMMLYIGYRFSKSNSDTEDFYLGGRKMGPLVTAMSAEASDMSSWLLMGLPGVAYLSGICDAFWTAAGLAVGTWLNWYFVSRKLRVYSSNLNAITIPDYFAKRFHDDRNVINAIAAVIIVIFFVPYTASGFAACGKLFNTLFGIDYMTAMIVSAIVIISYTLMGGFKAVCTTDLVQSIVMTVALVVVVGYGIVQAGGWGAVMDNAHSLAGYFSVTQIHDAVGGGAVDYSPLTIASLFAWGLGYFGMPHILVRFMSIEDEKKLVFSRRIATVWVIISMGVAIFIGVVGNAMSANGSMATLADGERTIMTIAGLISKHGVLPSLVAGVILAGILAATMSTADSQLLTAASGVTENLLKDFFHVRMDNKRSLNGARITIIIISVIAVFLAQDPNSNVFKIVSFAWAGFGGAFGAIMLLSLFWRRMNLQGALAGMVTGGAMVFIWKFMVRPMGGVLDIYELLPSFVVSLIFAVVVSLLTKAPDQTITDEFDAAKVSK
ncbi:MAG: sodium/proline symporter PutP [Lachnospiraceae bacterium]|nr:sodium/proline symporter PutP [Lachnospiraceae bacterium]